MILDLPRAIRGTRHAARRGQPQRAWWRRGLTGYGRPRNVAGDQDLPASTRQRRRCHPDSPTGGACRHSIHAWPAHARRPSIWRIKQRTCEAATGDLGNMGILPRPIWSRQSAPWSLPDANGAPASGCRDLPLRVAGCPGAIVRQEVRLFGSVKNCSSAQPFVLRCNAPVEFGVALSCAPDTCVSGASFGTFLA